MFFPALHPLYRRAVCGAGISAVAAIADGVGVEKQRAAGGSLYGLGNLLCGVVVTGADTTA
jgi:hypothetical protein